MSGPLRSFPSRRVCFHASVKDSRSNSKLYRTYYKILFKHKYGQLPAPKAPANQSSPETKPSAETLLYRSESEQLACNNPELPAQSGQSGPPSLSVSSAQARSTPQEEVITQQPTPPTLAIQLPPPKPQRLIRTRRPLQTCNTFLPETLPPTITSAGVALSEGSDSPVGPSLVTHMPAIPAQPTVLRLGSGKTPQSISHPPDLVLSRLMERMFALEEVSEVSPLTPDELKAEECFSKSHFRLPDGRFSVALPFKTSPCCLGESRKIALRRLLQTESRHAKSPHLRAPYVEFMKDYLDSNHMELAPPLKSGQIVYYIPHHAVHRPDDPPEKIRVVFNASQKSSSGISLNELLLPGPRLQLDIWKVVTRFRVDKWVFTADIRQMFRQIQHPPEDRDLLRILWRFDTSQPVQEYRLCTVTYGTTSAPYLACRVLQELALTSQASFPLASEILRDRTYVDDISGGGPTLEVALQSRDQLIQLLSQAQIELRKWASNQPQLLNKIPSEYLLPAMSSVCLENDEESQLKILGLCWNPSQDYFHFLIRSVPNVQTKRQLASQIAKVTATHAFLRSRYWIVNGKNVVRRQLGACNKCFSVKPTPFNPLMGQLPEGRVSASSPFTTTGIDYAGPFNVKIASLRSAKVLQSYLAIFVCFSTKAIHLELVTDLTTQAFLAALNRFVARRGVPSHIWSDNGTNFVGAKRRLKEVSALLNDAKSQEAILRESNKRSIEWHFIPPRAPHFGGLWEAAVKSTKRLLKVMLGTQEPTMECFLTIICQIEAILNSRPLTAVSSSPDDLQVLTPGHFLIMRPMTALPPDGSLTPRTALKSKWAMAQLTVGQFWKRWHKEYLLEQQAMLKWHSPSFPAAVGQIVMIMDDNLPPLQWSIGRIVQLHHGRDNVARVAEVRTTSGLISRPVRKLCPLPTQ
ncbi:uncharacterized protein [Rhodnius prolixus]|uniref:uncharacterized protein n=1 Tax=Rhodnius prolixus TaxID=13249 RepID=UPI003D18D227